MSHAALAIDVMSRNSNREMLIDQTQMATFVVNMQELARMTQPELDARAEQRMNELAYSYGYGTRVSTEKPFVYNDGIAIIPVHGSLINRFSYSWSFVTGYNFIRNQMNAALDDDDVHTIVFDINSYGGEAAGCFELANEIREARATKQLLAIVDTNCCSAAYAIGSAASKLVVSPSGQAGSIGVVSMHMDVSEYMKKMGIAITLVAEGEMKTAMNPYEPLKGKALTELEASISKRYGEFISLVVDNRSDKGLDEAAIRATQSRSYRADEALALNLIDAMETPANAVSSFLAELGDDDADGEEDETMSTKSITELQAEHAQTVASMTSAHASALAQAKTDAAAEAASAERTRFGGILAHAEAADRPKLAQTLAATPGMTVEQAGIILAAAAKETAPVAEAAPAGKPKPAATAATQTNFQAAMSAGADPLISDNAEGVEGEDGEGAPKAKGPSRAAMAGNLAFGLPVQTRQ